MLATVAALGLIVLLGAAGFVYRQTVLAQRVLRARQDYLEKEIARVSRAACWAGLSADTAVFTAQRAEADAIAARALVQDVRPTREA